MRPGYSEFGEWWMGLVFLWPWIHFFNAGKGFVPQSAVFSARTTHRVAGTASSGVEALAGVKLSLPN